MRAVRRAWPFLAALGIVLGQGAPAEADPRIVVSIKPLHSLVAGVVEGVAEPELLLAGGETPHNHALRPSQARALAGADAIFWIGPELETFLVKPLASLGKGKVVTVMKVPGMEVLPARDGGVWEAHNHGEHSHGDEHEEEHPAGSDPHLWLDPRNAAAIVRVAAQEAERLYPEAAGSIRANAAALLEKLGALDAEMERDLAPLRERPFIVFHDAYQYLERRYGLAAAGAITLNPEQSPGARRLREIRAAIRKRGALCVFAEPQFEPRLVATVVEGSRARAGTLDPLGVAIPPGPQAYFALMRQMGESLRACLEGGPRP